MLELPESQVGKLFAPSRSLSIPLQDLVNKYSGRLIHTTALVDDTGSVQSAAAEVKAKLDAKGLDVLVNNAGIGDFNRNGMKGVERKVLAHVFDVNGVGPHRVIAAFLPLREKGDFS